MKAWRASWIKMPETEGIYIADSRALAMCTVVRLANEVGYPAKFTEILCRRAPEYDAWAQRQPERRRCTGISEDIVRQELRQTLTR